MRDLNSSDITTTESKKIENIFKVICKDCKDHACCIDCFGSNGFYSIISTKYLQELKDTYGWNKNGFLGENGCLIPIELRSNMCLTWICKERQES